MGVAIAADTVLLGKYRIERVLGRGGMGVVVRARHLELDELVAIKVLRDEAAITKEMFARFAREAKAAAKLKSHHVVRVTDVGRLEDGLPYMVMELLEGMDLARTVRTGGPLEVGVAANLIIQACEALAEAHALGIVHRDVKPSNLFLVERPDTQPILKVLDFGIAKAPESMDFTLTKTASVLGTPAYMSPEQLRSSRSVDARTDIWALGVVLYEIIEGYRPFQAEQYSELILKIGVDPPEPVTRMAPPMAEVVMKCLSKDPQERYQRVADLALALVPFAADQAAAQHDIDQMVRLSASAALMGLDPQTPPQLQRGRLHEGTVDIASDADAATIRRVVPAVEPPIAHLPVVAPVAQRIDETSASPSTITSLRPRRGGVWIGLAAVAIAGGALGYVATRAEPRTVIEPVAAPLPADARVAEPTPIEVLPPPPPPPPRDDKVASPKKKRPRPAPAAGSATTPVEPTPAGSGSNQPCEDAFKNRLPC